MSLNTEHDQTQQPPKWRVNAKNMNSPQFEETRQDLKESLQEIATMDNHGNMNLNNSVKIE